MSKANEYEYWAASPSAEIADEIMSRVEDYYDYLKTSGRLALYRRAYEYYYRPRHKGAKLNSTGEQNELTSVSINHFRNLLVHLETMTVQQRASFEPRATNSDVKSQSQAILAVGLLDYYMREKKMERYLKQGVKDCLIFAEGFVVSDWDTNGGEVYAVEPETGIERREGDIKYTNYIPLNVIRDFRKLSSNHLPWAILRDFENKYELSAQYPELQEKIMSESKSDIDMVKNSILSSLLFEDSDDVAVYTLRHKPTAALPQGRLTRVLQNGTVLLDGPLPYRDINIHRIAPDEETGTIFGYTVGFDLLPIQESIDMLYSTVLTNQSTFGVQNIMMPKGHDISPVSLSGGLNLIEYDSKLGKPEVLNLTGTPPEIFNFITQLEHLAETISGVNSVARGNPEASLKSGAALALVQSMAIQFSMGLQQSYAGLLEDVGTSTIHILQDFAAVPRVALIAGKSNRSLMKEFSSKDLNLISRVTVDMGNPMTRTTAGKVNLAENLMQNELIDNADQYIQVLTTGRLEPVIEGKQAELLLIKAENEGLANGEPQVAIITDKHDQHVLEHKTVLASPEARRDPALLQTTLAHIQEHINFLKTADPVLLALTREPTDFVQPPPMPGAPQNGEAMNATPPAMQAAGEVNQPSMPQPPEGADPRSAELIQAQQ